MYTLKRGDLIFVRSSGFIGWGIRFLTQSEINHVAIYHGDEKLIEAQLGKGVQYNTIDNYLNDKNNYKVYAGYVSSAITNDMIEKAIAVASNELNKPYDLFGQIGVLVKIIVTSIGLGRVVQFYGKNIAQKTNAFWCSELVDYAYDNAGFKLTQVDQRYATPQDLAISKFITFANLD